MKVTIVIATRNRVGDLRSALLSCVEQKYGPLEILVFDDASTDGTAEAIHHDFPDVRVIRSEEHLGLIVLRSRGFREARGDIVFSLDDDAYFTCPDTVERTVELFHEHPQAAAIAMPYIEPRTRDQWRLMPRIPEDRRLRGFVGCAHAIRRDVALELGGYREFFVHQGEERDLAIRMLQAGYEIIYGDTPPIMHDYSPHRDLGRMSYYGVRNTLLFDMLNVPHPYLIPRLAIDAFNLFRYKLTLSSLPRRLLYIVCGLGACIRHWPKRRPVSIQTYRKFRSLPVHGPVPDTAIGSQLSTNTGAAAVFASASGNV